MTSLDAGPPETAMWWQGGSLRSDHIRNLLADKIAHGSLVVGSALDRQRLADRFGASRTPVREMAG